MSDRVITAMLSAKLTRAVSIVCLLMHTNGATAEKINNHLRIASFYNPLARLNNSSPTSKGYIERDLVHLLAKSLNFTFDVNAPRDTLQFGLARANGSWSGVFGQLQRKEVDVAISFGPYNLERSLISDATVGFITDNVILMIRYPEKNVKDGIGILTIYTTNAWLSIIGSAIAVTLVLWIVINYHADGDQEFTLALTVLFLIGHILSQGGNMRHRIKQLDVLPVRIILTAWLLSLVVLVYAYTTTLIGHLTAPKITYSPLSFEEAANDPFRSYVVKDSSAQEAFMGSSLKSFKQIAKTWSEHPDELLLIDSNTIVDLVFNHPYHLYFGGQVNAVANIEKDRKRNGKCRATLLLNNVIVRNNGLFLQKNSPFTDTINKQILLYLQAGVLRYAENLYSPSATACSLASINKRSDQPTQLSLKQLTVPFAILLVGIFLSLIAFLLCELYYPKLGKNISQ